jgi:hypothetical protein
MSRKSDFLSGSMSLQRVGYYRHAHPRRLHPAHAGNCDAKTDPLMVRLWRVSSHHATAPSRIGEADEYNRHGTAVFCRICPHDSRRRSAVRRHVGSTGWPQSSPDHSSTPLRREDAVATELTRPQLDPLRREDAVATELTKPQFDSPQRAKTLLLATAV